MDWKYVVGWILAACAIAVTVTYNVLQRRSQRRNRLVITATSQKLLVSREGLPDGKLAVEYNGLTVADPHLVSVSVDNHGPKDISTSDFDQKVPITVDLVAAVIGGGDSVDGPNAALVKISTAATSVDLQPALLAAGSRHIFTVVVDGPPTVTAKGAILNCDLTIETTPSTTRDQQSASAKHGIVAALGLIVASSLSAVAFSNYGAERSADSQTELREAVVEAVSQYEKTIDDQGEQLLQQGIRLDEQSRVIETLVKQLAPAP